MVFAISHSLLRTRKLREKTMSTNRGGAAYRKTNAFRLLVAEATAEAAKMLKVVLFNP